MSELFKNHPNILPFGITAASMGVFVVSCIYNQPEIALPSLALGGGVILKFARDFAEFDDQRIDLLKDATQIVDDTRRQY